MAELLRLEVFWSCAVCGCNQETRKNMRVVVSETPDANDQIVCANCDNVDAVVFALVDARDQYQEIYRTLERAGLPNVGPDGQPYTLAQKVAALARWHASASKRRR